MEQDKKLISLLITHYNRPLDLLKCLNAIKEINLNKYEIVVSDDGSEKENINLLKEYKIDKLLLSETNQGLAANINKGIKACNGEYILYCQEDFVLKKELKTIIPECLDILKNNKADMVRFTANINFKKLNYLTENISLIPKFSFLNFLLNYYQYSDHPFITKKDFYEKFGKYLEDTSGRYGEMEYAIRIFKSEAVMAITKKKLASLVVGSKSILINEEKLVKKEYKINKSIIKVLRAIRLYFEYLFYDKNKRGLITYRNLRQK